MSKKQQMRAFLLENKGRSWNATSLAVDLGWSKRIERTDKVRSEDEEGKIVEKDVDRSYDRFNSRKARTIAKKCGARINRRPDGFSIMAP